MSQNVMNTTKEQIEAARKLLEHDPYAYRKKCTPAKFGELEHGDMYEYGAEGDWFVKINPTEHIFTKSKVNSVEVSPWAEQLWFKDDMPVLTIIKKDEWKTLFEWVNEMQKKGYINPEEDDE